ncbi:MAG: hypothetical protein IT432_09250 [Phycisphaerales bacterium]|nr:hypothetical protein [Phycisphaerales bacterium]
MKPERTSKAARGITLFAVVAAAAMGVVPDALAQNLPAEPTKQPEKQSAANPLGGPKIDAPPSAASSLVSTDFNGTVRRLETTPEEAAVALLNLTGSAKERVDALFAKRGKAIEEFVTGNLDLLTKLDTAGKTNNKRDQLMLGLEAFQKLNAVWKDGTLFDQVKASLPDDKRAEFERLVTGYWNALVEEGKNIPNEEGKKRGRFEIVAGERLQAFVGEIGRAFERGVKSGRLIAEFVLKDLNLTDAQKARVREIIDSEAAEAPLKEDDKRYEGLFLKILGILDEKQRTAVLKRFRGE